MRIILLTFDLRPSQLLQIFLSKHASYSNRMFARTMYFLCVAYFDHHLQHFLPNKYYTRIEYVNNYQFNMCSSIKSKFVSLFDEVIDTFEQISRSNYSFFMQVSITIAIANQALNVANIIKQSFCCVPPFAMSCFTREQRLSWLLNEWYTWVASL
jgi:hypothetical protein